MTFRKVTITLPKNMYKEGILLVKKGLFSNFSDLVRSGIRQEFKELKPDMEDIDERLIYKDKELIAGVKQSVKEAQAGKGNVVKSEKEMDDYFESL